MSWVCGLLLIPRVCDGPATAVEITRVHSSLTPGSQILGDDGTQRSGWTTTGVTTLVDGLRSNPRRSIRESSRTHITIISDSNPMPNGVDEAVEADAEFA